MNLSQARTRVIEGHLQAKVLLLQTLNLGKSMPGVLKNEKSENSISFVRISSWTVNNKGNCITISAC